MVLTLFLFSCFTPDDDGPDLSGYEEMVRALAVPRGPGGAGWQAAQDRCASTFEALGYDVELHAFDEGINVIGRKESPADTAIVVSAHYDSVGGCTGADDNATGVAAVLELAELLAAEELAHDVVFACWDQEENGLLGSTAWVLGNDTSNLVEAWSFEMIGYASDEPNSQALPTGLELVFPDEVAAVAANDFRGDFITFVGDEEMATTAATFEGQADELGLPVVSLLLTAGLVLSPLTGDLKRSDHTPFWLAGVPAVMVTDSANFRNEAYHCNGVEDSVDRLDFDFATRVVEAAAETLKER